MWLQQQQSWTQQQSHYVPTEFGGDFYKQFNLAMKLKNEKLKKEGKMDAEINELTEESLFNVFGVI